MLSCNLCMAVFVYLYLCKAVFALNYLPSLCKLRDKLKTDESAICCSLLQKSIVIWRLLAVAQAQAQCTGTWHRHRHSVTVSQSHTGKAQAQAQCHSVTGTGIVGRCMINRKVCHSYSPFSFCDRRQNFQTFHDFSWYFMKKSDDFQKLPKPPRNSCHGSSSVIFMNSYLVFIQKRFCIWLAIM